MYIPKYTADESTTSKPNQLYSGHIVLIIFGTLLATLICFMGIYVAIRWMKRQRYRQKPKLILSKEKKTPIVFDISTVQSTQESRLTFSYTPEPLHVGRFMVTRVNESSYEIKKKSIYDLYREVW